MRKIVIYPSSFFLFLLSSLLLHQRSSLLCSSPTISARISLGAVRSGCLRRRLVPPPAAALTPASPVRSSASKPPPQDPSRTLRLQCTAGCAKTLPPLCAHLAGSPTRQPLSASTSLCLAVSSPPPRAPSCWPRPRVGPARAPASHCTMAALPPSTGFVFLLPPPSVSMPPPRATSHLLCSRLCRPPCRLRPRLDPPRAGFAHAFVGLPRPWPPSLSDVGGGPLNRPPLARPHLPSSCRTTLLFALHAKAVVGKERERQREMRDWQWGPQDDMRY